MTTPIPDHTTKRALIHAEALKMQCPMGMATGHHVPCRGIHCMAWRWESEAMKRIVISAENPMAQSIEEAGAEPKNIPGLQDRIPYLRHRIFDFIPRKPQGDRSTGGEWHETDESMMLHTPGYCGMVSD